MLMIRSWLSGRELLVREQRIRKLVSCGVPQGSVLGPTMWYVAYDYLLEMEVPPGIQLIGFADDLAFVGTPGGSGQLSAGKERRMDDKLRAPTSPPQDRGRHVDQEVGLQPSSTQNWWDSDPTQQTSKIPRGHMDSRLSFVNHTEMVAKKAATSATAFSRLMPTSAVHANGREDSSAPLWRVSFSMPPRSGRRQSARL